MTPVPTVCALIVTYNRRALLAGTLAGLAAQTHALDHVLVVDNASTDDTAAFLAAQHPAVEHLRLDRNTGSAGGFHAGLAHAQHAVHEGRPFDFVWVMDDDVVPEPDCLAFLLAVAASSGKAVVVPERREADGTVRRAEHRLDGARQRYVPLDCPTSFAAPATEPESPPRWCATDVFTFEGPLVHRRALDAAGPHSEAAQPDAGLFITADDTHFAIAVYHALGAEASALVPDAGLSRQVSPPTDTVPVRSALKGWLTGNPALDLWPDRAHWKRVYYFRNRHLVWKQLGWHRRRWRHAALHAGYLVTDALAARRRGWAWRTRLRWNARAFWLGLRGQSGAFLDPAHYFAEIEDEQSR
ncbi:MAG: glycosyltransferase [Bacteroidota bacterium]